jgi:hypothetical protein
MQDETVLYLSIGSFILMLAGLARLLLPMESLSEREILQDGYKKVCLIVWFKTLPLTLDSRPGRTIRHGKCGRPFIPCTLVPSVLCRRSGPTRRLI